MAASRSLRALAPRPLAALERRTFEIEVDDEVREQRQTTSKHSEESSVERIAVDETLELTGLDVRFAHAACARTDWNALTWLCWSAGLE